MGLVISQSLEICVIYCIIYVLFIVENEWLMDGLKLSLCMLTHLPTGTEPGKNVKYLITLGKAM